MPLIYNNVDIEQQAIKIACNKIKHKPQLLAEFLQDVMTNNHKDWDTFKYAKSEYKTKLLKGRAIPSKIQVNGGKNDNAYKMGVCFCRAKHGLKYMPQIQLHKYKTKKDKIKAIMSHDCADNIKADLIEMVF